jgi:recombination protein RecT
MATVKGGLLAKKQQENQVQTQQQTANKSVTMVLNNLLDSSGIRKRIDELLGKRAAQLCSSLITIANSTPEMQQAAVQNPMSLLQTGLKAATYDLPLGDDLGFAYPVAFYNTKKGGYECQFILGYKGLYQLAMRTGAYAKINVCDVRKGELKSWNRLTEDIELEFIEDEEEREKTKIVGYCGYFRTVNGMEKFVYWPIAKIQHHEERFRKGKYQSQIWRDDPDSMSRKTVLRNMISKWGIMSIDYRSASADVVAMANDAANGTLDDEEIVETIVAPQTEQQLPESTQEAAGAVKMPADAIFTADEIEAAVEGK